jgi:hypothetical protein
LIHQSPISPAPAHPTPKHARLNDFRLTAFRWFIEYGARFGTNWQNWATVVTPDTPAPFHPGLCAPFLKAPLLMVISPQDEMPGANPEVTRAVYELAPQPKELFEIEGGHFGLIHYPSPLFDLSSRIQCEFLISVRHPPIANRLPLTAYR